MYHLIDYIILY